MVTLSIKHTFFTHQGLTLDYFYVFKIQEHWIPTYQFWTNIDKEITVYTSN